MTIAVYRGHKTTQQQANSEDPDQSTLKQLDQHFHCLQRFQKAFAIEKNALSQFGEIC